jgi:CRISPR/Cas system Type II protein with McrA/HNH and RuvC-like nuclease domain
MREKIKDTVLVIVLWLTIIILVGIAVEKDKKEKELITTPKLELHNFNQYSSKTIHKIFYKKDKGGIIINFSDGKQLQLYGKFKDIVLLNTNYGK